MPRGPFIGDHITQMLVKDIDDLIIRNRFGLRLPSSGSQSLSQRFSSDKSVRTQHISRFY